MQTDLGSQTKSLHGKVALVTGASRGIGAAIARRLVKEGADLAFTYYRSASEKIRELVTELEQSGAKVLAIRADSGDSEAVAAAVRRTAEELGRLDILVNNAGVAIYKPIDELSLEEFDQTMAVNVRAVFVAVKAALPFLERGGRIITIGSCNAERMPHPGGSVYAMSKSALIGFNKGIARDLGPRGITSHLLSVGPTNTDMNPANSAHADGARSLMAIPAYADTADIAAFVAFLAGDQSSFITGAALAIDGGFAA